MANMAYITGKWFEGNDEIQLVRATYSLDITGDIHEHINFVKQAIDRVYERIAFYCHIPYAEIVRVRDALKEGFEATKES